jgi:UDP-N-acetyl-D-glucosamine dehydrogenase
MKSLNNLKSLLTDKSALIGIVGLGYVGLPLLLRFIEVGYRAIAFDIDNEKLKKLSMGDSYIRHISSEKLRAAKEMFLATSDFSRATECDALIICVPTPLDKYHTPDLSFVITTIETLLPHLRQGQIISLESTTWPGTTEEELLPRIESIGLKVGRDLALVFSPEREDPGNKKFNTRNIPKVVGGVTPKCLEMGISLYEMIIDQLVPVSSTRVAEFAKLLENIHRAVNIGLVNEIKIIADKMGLDVYEIIRAASTKPFGFVPYWPGPGLGGHCIPIDPFYLTWKAKEFGIMSRFIDAAGEVNSSMPSWVVAKVQNALNDHQKAVNGSRILILGLAYKKNIDDMRESPSIKLMESLQSKGGLVDYSDPYVPVFMKNFEFESNSTSIDITASAIASYDCILIATDHDVFDYEEIRKHAKLIVDTRGVYQEKFPNIVRA